MRTTRIFTEQVNWGNAYTFLGNEDDGGLSFFNARYYQKDTGRFMSCDAIKSVSSNLVINPYVYCGNNPVSYKDPTGLSREPRSYPDVGDGGGGQGQSRNTMDIMARVQNREIGGMTGIKLMNSMGINSLRTATAHFVQSQMRVMATATQHHTVYVNDKFGMTDAETASFSEYIDNATGTDVVPVNEKSDDFDPESQIYIEILTATDFAQVLTDNPGLKSDANGAGCYGATPGYTDHTVYMNWDKIRDITEKGSTEMFPYQSMWRINNVNSEAGNKNVGKWIGRVGAFIAMHEMAHIIMQTQDHTGYGSYLVSGMGPADYLGYVLHIKAA